MAATEITASAMTRGVPFALAAGTALSSDGALISLAPDERTIIILSNTSASAASVTIAAGNGVFGRGEQTVSVAGSSTALLMLESGAHTAVSGANAGKALITGSADVKVSAAVLA